MIEGETRSTAGEELAMRRDGARSALASYVLDHAAGCAADPVSALFGGADDLVMLGVEHALYASFSAELDSSEDDSAALRELGKQCVWIAMESNDRLESIDDEEPSVERELRRLESRYRKSTALEILGIIREFRDASRVGRELEAAA